MRPEMKFPDFLLRKCTFCILHSPAAAAALLLDKGTLNCYESPYLFYHISLTFQNPGHWARLRAI